MLRKPEYTRPQLAVLWFAAKLVVTGRHPSSSPVADFMPYREDQQRAGKADDGVAHYIASLLTELVRMARLERLEVLSFILEMARQEADENIRR